MVSEGILLSKEQQTLFDERKGWLGCFSKSPKQENLILDRNIFFLKHTKAKLYWMTEFVVTTQLWASGLWWQWVASWGMRPRLGKSKKHGPEDTNHYRSGVEEQLCEGTQRNWKLYLPDGEMKNKEEHKNKNQETGRVLQFSGCQEILKVYRCQSCSRDS